MQRKVCELLKGEAVPLADIPSVPPQRMKAVERIAHDRKLVVRIPYLVTHKLLYRASGHVFFRTRDDLYEVPGRRVNCSVVTFLDLIQRNFNTTAGRLGDVYEDGLELMGYHAGIVRYPDPVCQ